MRKCFVRLIVDAAIGQRLSACVRGAGHTLSPKHKFQLFCHVAINLMEIRQSSDIIFHNFSLNTKVLNFTVSNKVVR